MADNIVTLNHPQIGVIHGVGCTASVTQYLGIQYATLQDRFARGKLIDVYKSPVEATAVGPLPVANPQNCDLEHLLLQHELPRPKYTFSDTECLRLHVTAPAKSENEQDVASKLLPVVVFVHGGGFVTGSSSWPQWNLARFVETSVANDSPVVAVGINYRLGPFGFLTSNVLKEAGYLPNNGIHDQKLALRWVKKYIGGFGGDTDRITFLGHSIGGASGFLHLQSDEPLFQQLVAMGGSSLIPPAPPMVGEVAFGMVTKALGVDSADPAKQIRVLLETPAEELDAKASESHAPLNAILDGDVIRTAATYEILSNPDTAVTFFPGVKWCKRIFVTDSQLDGMIFAVTVFSGKTDNLMPSLESHVATVLGEDAATSGGSLDVNDALAPYLVNRAADSGIADGARPTPVINFMGDVCFGQAARFSAEAWASMSASHGTEAYLARFNAPNPWPGLWRGYASHGIELAFALQNYKEFLPDRLQRCSERMARDLITFVLGEEPFAPLRRGGSVMVYDGAAVDGDECRRVEEVSVDDLEKTGRYPRRDPVLLDRLMAALLLLMQGA